MKSNRIYETVTISPIYAIINCKSEMISSMPVPRNVATVRSMPNFIIGSIIGKDRTGKSAFLELALEIIAEITVVEDATAIEEIVITRINSPWDLTVPEFEKIKNSISEKKLINKLNKTLNINLPK